MVQIKWTKLAIEDLKEIHDYESSCEFFKSCDIFKKYESQATRTIRGLYSNITHDRSKYDFPLSKKR